MADQKSGSAPTHAFPCKHPSHTASQCGNQIGIDQELCVDCQAYKDYRP
jgi:hypothetical protein